MTTTPVMTITDEQIAEIEAEAKWCSRASISSEVESDELLAIISRLRAAEKDAGRYRWLRDKSSMPGVLSSDSNAAKYFNEYMLCGEQMDKVIDAAMEQSK